MNHLTLCGNVPVLEALQQATMTPRDATVLEAASRASEALRELLAVAGPELLIWHFLLTNPGATISTQHVGMEMLACSLKMARDATTRGIVQ